MHKLSWGVDSIIKVSYNPVEHDLIAATGIDNSVLIYDTRG